MGDTTATNGGDNSLSERNAGEEVSRLVEQTKELQESTSALISRNSQDDASLRQRALALDSIIKMLRSFIASSVNNGNLDSKHAEKLSEELSRARYTLSEGDAATYLPCKSHGSFLRMFLGPINVRANRKDVQLKVKEEYYSFRDRTAYLFLFFPSLLLVLRSQIWDGCFPALPVQLYQVDIPSLLCYGYGTCQPHLGDRKTTRLCPEAGMQLFLRWAIIAMLLQNRYQRQRLYTRIVMGKSRRMDVVWGETAGVKGQLWLLLPILFVLQTWAHGVYKVISRRRNVILYLRHPLFIFSLHAFEAYVGALLLQTAVVGLVFEWQVVTCGILLIIMAVGNFVNTVQSLVLKSQFKAKMRKGKSTNDLTRASSPKKDR